MKQKNIVKQKKGFTLLEVLLVLALVGILLAITLVTFDPIGQIAEARNNQRNTDILRIESALTQYRLQEGSYPAGITRNHQEICDPDASTCAGYIDLSSLVPTYLNLIPQDPEDDDNTGGSGYSIAVDNNANIVSLIALRAESSTSIAINNPLPPEVVEVVDPPEPTIISSGLVLHLDAGNSASYPGTGTIWTNLIGGINNATLINGVGYNSGNGGGALIFDGTNDFINLGSFFTYPSFTISLWVYPATTQNSNADIFDNNHSGTRNFVLQQSGSSTNVYQFGVNDASGSISVITLSTLPANTWTHLSFTFSPTDRVRAYINGSFHSQGNLAGGRSILYSSQTLNIGRWASGGRHWRGSLSQFMIYDRVLTPVEIQQNFNVSRERYGI